MVRLQRTAAAWWLARQPVAPDGPPVAAATAVGGCARATARDFTLRSSALMGFYIIILI